MPANTSKNRVRFLYKRLFKYFGPQHWWPAGSAWEMMVGAILTQNTSWTNVEKALAALKREKALSVRAIARMPRRKLQRLIRPSGYFRQKADRLQRFAIEMIKHPLPPLLGKVGMGGCRRRRGPPTSILPHKGGGGLLKLRQRLLSFHGIGPETADSMLLYAGGLPTFVVDAYTRRIGQRMGLFRTDDYHEVQVFFHERLPSNASLYNEYHALLVRLAKDFCTKRDPTCAVCPVKRGCAHAQKRNR